MGKGRTAGLEAREALAPAFAQRALAEPIPKWTLPEREMPARTAQQLIEDERGQDANPRRNLASFVTTWMEPEAEKVMFGAAHVNAVDADEYPSVAKFEGRCVAMLADLLHAEGKGPDAAGAASIGSSEAIMLGGLAMKLKWRERRRAKAGDKRELEGMAERPNLVMAANTQVCWHKFCRYFDVEAREVPNDDEHLVLNVEKALEMCDENTIGVCGILGSTYTGEFEDIKALDAGVEALKASKGLTIPIHVDGASGGFVAPFVWPDLEWDFRLKNVVSMNLSGHKFGLVYAGIGWVVWRSWSEVPEPMIFHTNYLGADMKSITMNFSKSASCIVGQYYQVSGACGRRAGTGLKD